MKEKEIRETNILFESIEGETIEDKLVFIFYYYLDEEIIKKITYFINIKNSLRKYFSNLICEKTNIRKYKNMLLLRIQFV